VYVSQDPSFFIHKRNHKKQLMTMMIRICFAALLISSVLATQELTQATFKEVTSSGKNG
jgi:hypothetical protein